jgi:NADH-quinone oxidoreductase subunit N
MIYYLAGYLLMTYMAFIVVVLVAKTVGGDDISDFNGLARRSPGLALGMVVAMASLAGLPFTVGFLGKFFIFVAAFQDQQYLLIVLGAITVACGFYYYLKVVRAMYWQPSPEGAVAVEVSPLSKVLLILLSVGIFALGLFPQLIFSFFQ